MDGVAIILALLTADSDVIALVPDAQISAGVLPAGTALDAISVTRVSGVDRNIIAPRTARRVTERVQVTALAATYPAMKAILRAARQACADFIGAEAGLTEVTVHTDSAGPDFMNEDASLHMGSQDFMVGYSETR